MNHYLGLQSGYRRFLAWGMSKADSANEATIELQDCPDHATMADLKRSLLGHLQGRVLEIGPGAGLNLAYYPKTIEWIGVDLNPFMATYIREEAERLGLTSIDLHTASAEHLDIADNSVDAVVSTYVLCSVEDLEGTLQEILRVLKPGGGFIFIEHVAAPPGTWLRQLQGWIKPVWKVLADGCHPDRETGLALEQAGFQSVEYQTFKVAIPVVSPHIAGVAIR
jgi:ubiquinone/menaquinone biosynthesis C-methylase UbiE